MHPPDRQASYIIGRLPDALFLIYAPLVALAVAGLWQASDLRVSLAPLGVRYKSSVMQFFIASFTYAHIVLVVVRTHLNPGIFSQHRLRFTLVPAVLFALLYSSNSLAILGAVAASLWDVYHSSQQTFGLGRMYDARAGNDPLVGRRADYWMNLVLYIGPIVGGAALVDHLRYIGALSQLGPAFFGEIPAMGERLSGTLARGAMIIGILAIVQYLFYYGQLAREGYRVSSQKVALFASTAFTSLIAWGFNPWGKAFFIMNFFHALQYFALVWWAEKKNVMRQLRLTESPRGPVLGLAVLVFVALGVGLILEVGSSNYNSRSLYCLAVTASLMHFWWDGFVWSVQKKQV